MTENTNKHHKKAEQPKTPGYVISMIFTILAFITFTYSLMVIITHYSLHFKNDDYNFSHSLKAIIDFKAGVANDFLVGFLFFNLFVVLTALCVHFINQQVKKAKNN